MATNLGIKNVLKIKMKKEKNIRKQKNMKIKTENLILPLWQKKAYE